MLMGLEVLITQEEHGHLNEVVVEGFKHRFSGVRSMMETVIVYAVSRNIEAFSEAALEMYNELLPKELKRSPGNWLRLGIGQSNLLFIEKFLLKRGLIDEPILENHLKPEPFNLATYARDHGFDPEILAECIKESGQYPSLNHGIRSFVDTVRKKFDSLDMDRRTEEFYGLQVYRILEEHIERRTFLPVLKGYLLKTGQLLQKEAEEFKLIDDLSNYARSYSFTVYWKDTVRKLHDYIKRKPSGNPVLAFYQAVLEGEEKLGSREFDGRMLLKDYLSKKDISPPKQHYQS